MAKKLSFLLIIFVIIASLGTTGTAEGMIVEDASAKWKRTPRYPSELLKEANKVEPRIVVEYATTIFEQEISPPESFLQKAETEPTGKTSGVSYTVTYEGPEFTIKDKEGQVLGTGTVSTTKSPYWPSNDYKIVDYAVGDVDDDGTKEVVLIARHVKWYPGQVYVVEADGSEISRYWNPGFVYSLKLYDIEDDGTQEILVGATNNDKRDNFNVPAVFALGARTMKGEAPPRYGSLGSGAEIWYTFPDLTRGAGIRSLSISEGSLLATTGDGTQFTLRPSDGKVMSSSS